MKMYKHSVIDEREISPEIEPYIIAEMSANHNGSIENAFQIIDMAKRCGADAVKIQTYTADTLTLDSNKDEFLIKEGLWKGRSLYQLYEWAHTPWDWHKALFDHAKHVGITLFSTPFDASAVEFLEELNTPAYKIASFECTDLKLIEKAAQTKKPLIISTGMANTSEIQDAVDTALTHGSGELTLLHCVSGYPAAENEYNLSTIADMKKRYDVQVGLSDHTIKNTTAITAIALGAVMVEKHFTLDRKGGGPDDSFSLEPSDLKELCTASKIAWSSLGKVNYERTKSELGNIKFRRSLYFVRSLKKGETVSHEHIKSVRPGYGLSPKFYDYVIGKQVNQNIEKDTPVKTELLK
jgi:pseudaminic acid synthase